MLPRRSKLPLSSAYPQQASNHLPQSHQQQTAMQASKERHVYGNTSPTAHVHPHPSTTFRHISPDPSPEQPRHAHAHSILIGDSPCTPADAMLYKDHASKQQQQQPQSPVIPPPSQSRGILLDRHDVVTPSTLTPDSSADHSEQDAGDDSQQSYSEERDEDAEEAASSSEPQRHTSDTATPNGRAGRASPAATAPSQRKKKRRVAKSSNAVLPEELQGHYTVTEYLGSGSYGHVYLANPTDKHPLHRVPTAPASAPTAATGSDVAAAASTPQQIPSQVAIKKIVHIFDNLTNAKRLLREIKILRMMSHANIIGFKGLLPPPEGQLDNFNDLSMVFEYVDTDLQKLIHSNQHFSNLHIQFFLYQLLCGMEYIHSANIIHRDIKPANILVNADCTLKICDFGLSRLTTNSRLLAKSMHAEAEAAGDARALAARRNSLQEHEGGFAQSRAGSQQSSSESTPTNSSHSSSPAHHRGSTASTDSHTSSSSSSSSSSGSSSSSSTTLPSAPQPSRTMTKHVVTRWYRAPELILLSEVYSTAIDLWSIGCILAELLSMQQESQLAPQDRQALFPGRSCFPLSAESPLAYADQLDQLNVIFDVIGTPSEADLCKVDNVTARNYIAALPKKRPMNLSSKFLGSDPLAIDLLHKLLRFNPSTRITASEALAHPYLKEMREGQVNPLFSINASNYQKYNLHHGWDFEDETMDEDRIRALILDEILLDHPHLKNKIQSQQQQPQHTPVPILKPVPTRKGSEVATTAGTANTAPTVPASKLPPPTTAAAATSVSHTAAMPARAATQPCQGADSQAHTTSDQLLAPHPSSPTSGSSPGYRSSSCSSLFTHSPMHTSVSPRNARTLSRTSSLQRGLLNVASSSSITSLSSVSPEPPTMVQHTIVPLPHPQHGHASSYQHAVMHAPAAHSSTVPVHLAAPPTPTMEDLAGDHQTHSPQQTILLQHQAQQLQPPAHSLHDFPYTPTDMRGQIRISISSCETPMPAVPHSTLQHTPRVLTHQQLAFHNNSFRPAVAPCATGTDAHCPAHSSLPYSKPHSSPLYGDATLCDVSSGITPHTSAFSLTCPSSSATAASSVSASASAVATFASPPSDGAQFDIQAPGASFSVMPRVQRPKRRHEAVTVRA